MPVLKVENLTYTYSPKTPFYKDAITDVSFSAEKGEIIGIIGHTGSGKSTLLQHLNGLLKPSSGNVYFNDKNIWDDPKKIREIRSKIGLVFQYPEYQLFDETVYKDIAFGPKNMGCGDAQIDIAVRSAAAEVGLEQGFLDKSPFDLSGGEKRRVAIAGILAMQPEIIAFDEPTAGLDPMGRENVIRIIREYRKKYNATIFIVSHSMEDLARIADKIIVMSSGKMVMFDTPKNVFSDRELLLSYGLDVPAITRVILSIKEHGIDLGEGIITVEQAVDAIKRYRKAVLK